MVNKQKSGIKMANKEGYGKKDGTRKGANSGGNRRNKTSVCRHPRKKK
jgi:hypothetical protein